MTHRNPSMRLARWRIKLEHYTFRIEYRKGSQHGDADGLSRWPLPDEDEEGNDDYNDIIINCIIVEREDALIKITHQITTDQIDKRKYIELDVQIINYRPINGTNMQQKDPNIKWITSKLQQFRAKPDDDKIPINNAEQGVYRKEWNRLFIDHKTLWRRGEDKIGNQVTQFVVPNHQRPEIMDKMHSNVLSGHLMFEKQ